jgi:hypothetical protein
VANEKRFGACETLGRDKDVASVAEYEGSAPFAADPVADLVPYNGAEYAEEDGAPEAQVSPLNQDARGDQDGLAGQGHPHALGHHP